MCFAINVCELNCSKLAIVCVMSCAAMDIASCSLGSVYKLHPEFSDAMLCMLNLWIYLHPLGLWVSIEGLRSPCGPIVFFNWGGAGLGYDFALIHSVYLWVWGFSDRVYLWIWSSSIGLHRSRLLGSELRRSAVGDFGDG